MKIKSFHISGIILIINIVYGTTILFSLFGLDNKALILILLSILNISFLIFFSRKLVISNIERIYLFLLSFFFMIDIFKALFFYSGNLFIQPLATLFIHLTFFLLLKQRLIDSKFNVKIFLTPYLNYIKLNIKSI